jgi:magnesium transporter
LTVVGRLYSGQGKPDRDIELDGTPIRPSDDQLLWVDIDRPDEAEMGRLAGALELRPRDVATVEDQERDDRFLRTPGHMILALNALRPGTHDEDGRSLEVGRLDVVIGPNTLATIHDGPIDGLEEVQRQLQAETRVGDLDAGQFMTILIDEVLAAFLREIEAIERQIDALDDLALRARAGHQFVLALVGLRRRIAGVRRALVPNREALGPLVRPDVEMREELGKAWPGLIDRLERTIDAAENTRELLVGSHDIYQAEAAQRTNDVMKALTLVSAVLLPAVVLAGIMGMNFQLDFFDNAGNFLIVIATMVGLAVAVLVVARLRNWI